MLEELFDELDALDELDEYEDNFIEAYEDELETFLNNE